MGFNSAFKGLKLLKNPGNGRLKNLNDPVLNVLMIHNAVGKACKTVLEEGVSSCAVTLSEGLAPALPNLSQVLLGAIFLLSAQVILPILPYLLPSSWFPYKTCM